jgi:hypothetical protein
MKRLVTLACLLWTTAALAGSPSDPNYLPCDMNNWAATGSDWPSAATTSFVWVWQYKWTSDSDAFKYFKITRDNDYDPQWGGDAVCASPETPGICTVAANGGNASFKPIANKLHYINIKPSGADQKVAIWAVDTTSAAPPINSLTAVPAGPYDPGSTVAIQVSLGAALVDPVKVYVRWWVDGGAANGTLKGTLNGGHYDVSIPVPGFADADAGKDIKYYAFTATAFDAATVDSFGDYDLQVLTMNNAAGASYTLDVLDLANAWHDADLVDAGLGGVITMRNPLSPAKSTANVYFYNGNQFQGAGRASDQSGLKLWLRKNNGAWSSVAGAFDSQAGDNKFWKATLPFAGSYQAGDVVDYYLEANFTNRNTTYLYTNAGNNVVTGKEATARASAWQFTVPYTLGTAYHKPDAAVAEPAGKHMRDPLAPDLNVSGTFDVYAADATGTVASVILYQKIGTGGWTTQTKTTAAVTNEGGKDYYKFTIDATGQLGGTHVLYYFKVVYKNPPAYDVTYVYANGATNSQTTGTQATAEAGAFDVTLAGPAIPTLSEWAMIVLLAAMAAYAFWALRRRVDVRA